MPRIARSPHPPAGGPDATYTVEDWLARDLDAVLTNISTETDVKQRRRRAVAVLATLFGARDRLDRMRRSARPMTQTWQNRGRVEAWWISSAASIAWFTAENGTAAAPDALSIKSAVNVAFQGDDPGLYLDPALNIELYRETLAKLGVAGDPTVLELIDKLEEIREGRWKIR